MKPTFLVSTLALSLTSACTIHVHVHEAPAPLAQAVPTATAPEVGDAIAGRVVDEAGDPVRARVAVVTASGSRSMSTGNDGSFRFTGLQAQPYVVTASTPDAAFTSAAGVRPGRTVELFVRPGATLEVEMRGRRTARLAVFHAGVRVADFTLRDGRREAVVLPPGALSFCLYGEDLEVARELTLDAGETGKLAFEI